MIRVWDPDPRPPRERRLMLPGAGADGADADVTCRRGLGGPSPTNGGIMSRRPTLQSVGEPKACRATVAGRGRGSGPTRGSEFPVGDGEPQCDGGGWCGDGDAAAGGGGVAVSSDVMAWGVVGQVPEVPACEAVAVAARAVPGAVSSGSSRSAWVGVAGPGRWCGPHGKGRGLPGSVSGRVLAGAGGLVMAGSVVRGRLACSRPGAGAGMGAAPWVRGVLAFKAAGHGWRRLVTLRE